jgi:hypothetical protein
VRYFWCWLFPPLGMMACSRPFLAMLNLLLCLTILGIPFAVLWAFLIASETSRREDLRVLTERRYR